MLNLGNITFGLAVDTSGLDRGARVLEGFGRRVDNAMAQAARGVDYNTEALRKQEGAAVRALQQVQNMANKVQNSKLDPQVRLDNIVRMQQAYEQLARTMATPINRPLDALTFQRTQLGFKEQMDAVTRAMAAQSTVAQKASNDVTNAFAKQQNAALRAEQQIRSLNDQISRAASSGAINQRTADALTSRANAAQGAFSGQMQNVGMDPRQVLAAQLNLKNAMQGIQRDMKQSASAVRPLQAAFHGLSDSAALVIGPLNGVVFRLRASHDMMERYGVAVGGTAAALSGLALSMLSLGQAILQTEIAYQKADVTLTGLLRSTAMADAELAFLRQTAMDAGLAFNQLAPQFSRFVAAAEGSGQGLSETNEQFRQMAMLSGTLHLTTDEVNRIMLAFDQMLSAGRIMGDDMRQLRNVLPAAYEAAGTAAERMGTKFRDASGKINDLNPSQFIGNLLDVYMEMFSIDLTKPIDTLQADLNRVQGAWEQMILSISTSIGASEGFQAVFDGISESLLWMSQNMDIVMATVGGLTGALTGLFAAMAGIALIQGMSAAWTALNTVIALGNTLFIGARTALLGFSVAQTGAMLTTAQLTAAQTGLNAAMTANPIGIVIKSLALLGGAIFGATMAYNAMTEAVAANQAKMADMSSIDSYIAKMKEKGKQVGEVTKALQAQVTEHMRLQAAESAAAMNELAKMQRELEQISGPLGGLGNLGAYFKYGGANTDNGLRDVQENLKGQIAIQEALLMDHQKNVADLHGRFSALGQIGRLPEDNVAGDSTSEHSDRNGRQRNAERGLKQIDDILNRSRLAQQALDNMWRGPTHSGLVDTLAEVNKRLFDMEPDQIARLTQMFREAGLPVEDLSATLAVVTLRTNAAEDAVKRFNSVWEDLQSGREELEAINRQLDFLSKGGDPSQMFMVDALNQARDTIRELTAQDLPQLRETLKSLTDINTGEKIFNDAGIEAIASKYESSNAAGLEALKRALADLGYEGASAEEALTNFYASIGRGQSNLQAATQFFGDFNDQVRDYHNMIESVSAAQGGASLEQLINLDYLQQAAEATRYLDQTAIAGLVHQLETLGMEGDSVNEMLANFYRHQEDLATQSEQFRAILEQQAEAWSSFGTNTVDSLRDALTGVEDFRTAALNVLNDLATTILNAAIFDPLKTQLQQVITDMVNGKEGVGFGDIASTFGRAGMRFFGQGGSVNGGKDEEAAGQAAATLDLFNTAVKDGADTMNVDFLTSLFRATVGTTAEASAKSVNVLTMNAATTALVAFTAAVSSAAAASAASSTANTFQTAAAVFAADGGQIFGPGGDRGDKIPAMLSNKEFIVNSKAAQNNLQLLHAINRGAKVRMFADGGEVGPDMAPSFTGFAGGPEKSGLTNSRVPVKIDASSKVIIQGNVSAESLDELEARLTEHREQLYQELPYLIDQQVLESSSRGRY